MAKSSPVRNASRSLVWLGAIVVVLGLVLGGGVLFAGASFMPKLGLDLEGGTEIILTPQLEGGQTISSDELNQAVSIIRERVDASGVSEAQVSTQGSDNIVVAIPGTPDQATMNRIKSSSKMELRPVLLTGSPTNTFVGSNGKTTPYPSPAPSLQSTPTSKPTNGSDTAWVTPALQAQYDAFDCSSLKKDSTNSAPANEPLITCDDTLSAKYLLGPVEVEGSDITNATAGIATDSSGNTTGQWVVNLTFNSKGTKDFAAVSTRLYGYYSQDSSDPRSRFAFVLDGKVLEAPAMQGAITNGEAQISGSFDQTSATTLADQLKFGALPVSFKVQSSDTISATLGSAQLLSGLIAGGIGLLLVVIYTLFQYRLLGLVTITSLVVAALLTYLVIAILSWRIDYRLSLAGVAGLIVAIGFTADSFIVYFERIRDELRDGRTLESAVEAGWKRAKRTIYASKSTNLLAAIVLYVLAVGNVQGFAFTLGVTTVLDVLIVILFTHPTLQLLARTRFFSSGHRLSGLDPDALGAVYRGAAQFRTSTAVSDGKRASSSREAARRQTIAERKQAELVAANGGKDEKDEKES
ncbi:protein translocase subunit SecD [Humibacter ginsenosidimutans]|uniref:Protein translocase subunit SecD n=1 Tax=Humibacter ginsenosidimutans TaxID=2599293 RepID=A0A5B8M1Y4_9MICO|nr:protein translocase subunit SecD [Humibacter ginsenosidimutans]QDZ13855.1 protein translocase subunit SecD [Humibacter ginsenosidimutans]